MNLAGDEGSGPAKESRAARWFHLCLGGGPVSSLRRAACHYRKTPRPLAGVPKKLDWTSLAKRVLLLLPADQRSLGFLALKAMTKAINTAKIAMPIQIIQRSHPLAIELYKESGRRAETPPARRYQRPLETDRDAGVGDAGGFPILHARRCQPAGAAEAVAVAPGRRSPLAS